MEEQGGARLGPGREGEEGEEEEEEDEEEEEEDDGGDDKTDGSVLAPLNLWLHRRAAMDVAAAMVGDFALSPLAATAIVKVPIPLISPNPRRASIAWRGVIGVFVTRLAA